MFTFLFKFDKKPIGLSAFKPNGTSYDLGLPGAFRNTVWEYGKNE